MSIPDQKVLSRERLLKKLWPDGKKFHVQADSYISKYQNNSKIALISDAGAPLISDPGFKFVKDFIPE